jgi:hypothetical protein
MTEQNKKRAIDYLYDVINKERMDKVKISAKEIGDNIFEIDNYLIRLGSPYDYLYRYYKNINDWDCDCCNALIVSGEGYWASSRQEWSDGMKLCHRCFLIFMAFLETSEVMQDMLCEIEVKKNNQMKEEYKKLRANLEKG